MWRILMSEKISGIYNIICLPNQKVYIGSSNNIYRRYYLHLYELRKNKHTNIHLQRAFNKY
ncbi:MAG: GIY-YIG nuclease family protein [Petrotogales bacterium]